MKKVKSITVEEISGSIEEASEEDWQINSFTEYDLNSNLLTEIEYLPTGEIESKSTYKYDEK